MEYRRLGSAGMKVSEIALGTAMGFALDDDQTMIRNCVKTAYDCGVNFIDMADVYPVYAHGEAEQTVGWAIRDLGLRRQDLVLSSKVFWSMSDDINDRGLSRKHIFESVHNSLRRLGTDYLDIYYCHRHDPETLIEGHDPETLIEEVVRAMDDLIRQGKVIYWGTGAWAPAQIGEAVAVADRLGAYRPRAEQPWYSMLARHIEGQDEQSREKPPDYHVEPAVLDTCARYGIGVTVFWPLGQGLLAGKYTGSEQPTDSSARTRMLAGILTEDNLAKAQRLADVAKECGLDMAQLALAWILRRSEVSSVIVGATREAHIVSNVKASGVRLPSDVLNVIEHILQSSVE
jgi:aryl-alcohol dehydrogenase-like predicted oxidoreductase